MSKRKKKKNLFGVATVDSHHIFFTKTGWSSRPAHRLRTHWYCVVEIPRGTLHHKIHDKVRYVPVPRECNIIAALTQLDLLEYHEAIKPTDPLEKRLRVLISLFSVVEQPTADALEKQLEVVCEYNKPSE